MPGNINILRTEKLLCEIELRFHAWMHDCTGIMGLFMHVSREVWNARGRSAPSGTGDPHRLRGGREVHRNEYKLNRNFQWLKGFPEEAADHIEARKLSVVLFNRIQKLS